ncbi:MAG: hypothetical protein ACREC6_12205 [Hyphomicrobiaceae bacterium]
MPIVRKFGIGELRFGIVMAVASTLGLPTLPDFFSDASFQRNTARELAS